MKILVTDGEQRAALATVRSLGRAGYEVHVCSPRSTSLAGASRYATGAHVVADPLHTPSAFVYDVAQLAAALDADVLLPITEAALLAILPERNRFDCTIPFASTDSFRNICDKRRVMVSAARHGIAVPKQLEVATASEVARINGDLQFPMVLKPFRSVVGKEEKRIHTGVRYARTSIELRRALDEMPAAAYPLLIQQRIDGPGFGISILVWDGKLLAAFAHRRIREKPPSGGVSVLRESIPLDPDLLSRSLAVLRDFRWQGVAMVEFKLDEVSGIPYIMEINGRLWGSLQLAVDAGVDFPKLLVEAATGRSPTPITAYEAGLSVRWEWGEVDHLLASLFHKQPDPRSHGEPSGRRARALGAFLRAFASTHRAEVFRSDDPKPFLRETIDWFRRR